MSAPWSRVPGRAVADRRLGNSAFRVLAALGVHADASGKTWASLPRLAADMSVSIRQVSKGIAELESLGYLVGLLSKQPEAPPLCAGEVVTTGVLTDAHPVKPGEVWTTAFEGLPLHGLTVEFS